MRTSLLLLTILSISGAQASWFGSDTPQYAQWSSADLQKWLREHNINIPSSSSHDQLQELVESNWKLEAATGWTQEQYASAQRSFQDLRDWSFDAWDESRLRNFLLEQGVVAPSGPREQLVLLAKQHYRAYQDAASSFASSASSTIYGSTYQTSKSLSSIAAQATKDAARTFDNAKDYVYSMWDDARLENYLRDKGVLKEKSEKNRQQLLTMMQDAYAKIANPVWEAWSDSYIHQWLVDHNIIKSDFQNDRDALINQMKSYYYNINDRVWDTWSDSDLKAWLIEHDTIKSDAQIDRDKLIKLVADNYANAVDTIWSGWSESDMRSWLIEHGYLKSDAHVTRDELVKLMNDRYNEVAGRIATYLVWPDARLRAYLRERGISETALPTGRPGLLQEVRIRWVQATNGADALFARIREIVDGSVEAAEESIGRILDILGGRADGVGQKAKDTDDAAGEKLKKSGEKLTGEL